MLAVALVAPAADAVHRRLPPASRAIHQASGMLCRMPPVVQHESPELSASDGSVHSLLSLPNLPVIARWNDLYQEGLPRVHYTTERL